MISSNSWHNFADLTKRCKIIPLRILKRKKKKMKEKKRKRNAGIFVLFRLVTAENDAFRISTVFWFFS